MIILFVLAIVLIIFIIRCQIPDKTQSNKVALPPVNNTSQKQVPSKIDYSNMYKRKYIFSLNEKSEYRKLVTWAKHHGYDVFPKMRLADLIEPRNDDGNYYSLFSKIKSKHVDFVVCRSSLPRCRLYGHSYQSYY